LFLDLPRMLYQDAGRAYAGHVVLCLRGWWRLYGQMHFLNISHFPPPESFQSTNRHRTAYKELRREFSTFGRSEVRWNEYAGRTFGDHPKHLADLFGISKGSGGSRRILSCGDRINKKQQRGSQEAY
jgi:hypothetical protein